MDPTTFETHPSRYHHWKLVVAGDVATLTMAVDGDHPHKPGYELKLNSYDLSVDIELFDAVQRLRFEQPQVRARGMQISLDHPAAGPVPLVGSPLRFSDTPVEYRLPPPQLGEHTDAVLAGLLGKTTAEIAALRAVGVV